MMTRIYQYLESHKILLYILLLGTSLLFIYFGSRISFEENIAKLLPSSENMNVDIAFQDLRVKDMVFVQITSEEHKDASELASAMDLFMSELEESASKEDLLHGSLYSIDPMELMDVAYYLPSVVPNYLEFTDERMDSLCSVQHIRQQLEQYNGVLESETGALLYDFIAMDPIGIHTLFLGNGRQEATSSHGFRLIDNHLFCSDSTVCIGFLSPNVSSSDSGTSKHLLRCIKAAASTVGEQYEGVEVLYHGTVIQSANNSIRILKDLFTTIGVSLLLILLLLAICMKDPKSMLLLLLPIVYGTFMALACIYWGKGIISLMSISIGAIVLGVALSYSLHVMVHFKYTGSRERVVKEQSLPVILGSLTTIGAFAGLLFTQSSLLQDFGWFAGISVVGTTLASLLFMPHFFPKKNIRNERAFGFMEKINAYPIDQNRYVQVVLLCFVVITICFSGRYSFDPNLRHINYTAPEVERSQQLWAEKNNGGFAQQYYASVSTDLNTALRQLRQMEAKCDSLQQSGLIGSYQRTSVLLPDVETQARRIDHWKRYFTEEKQRDVLRNVRMACSELGIDSEMYMPFGDVMEAEYAPSLIIEDGILPDNVSSILAEKAGDNWLVYMPIRMPQEHLTATNDAMDSVEGCMVLDPYYYSTNLVELIHQDFNKILFISSIFVLIVLLLSYRRLLLALIAFLPMLLSWYVVLGSMAITHQSFNIINIIVSSFIFGIGVDYSIFIMDGLLASARGEDSKRLGYHKTAITMSATILIVCMASLLFAVHPAIHSIGFASVVGMITTMMLSYVLQPFLFKLAIRSKRIRKAWKIAERE